MLPSRRGRRQQRRRTTWLVIGVLVAGALVAGYYLTKPKTPTQVIQLPSRAPSTQTVTTPNPAPSPAPNVAPTTGQQVTLPAEATGGAQLALRVQNGQPVSILKLDSSGKATDAGTSVTLPDDSVLSLQDAAPGRILVKAGHMAQHAPATVDLPDPSVKPAAGGEPIFKAFAVVSGQVQSIDYYEAMAPKPKLPDQIIVDKGINALWLYQGGKLVLTKRVATGRYVAGPVPTAANQDRNYVTPIGSFKIGQKIVDPVYYAHNIPGGDPRNPLGTRFMGLSVFQGDGANVWAIHGTNEPDKIGQWVSDGCIRLKTSDAEQLFGMVQVGTTVEIIDSEHKG